MKFGIDKKYLLWGITLLITACLSILFCYVLFKGADFTIGWHKLFKILMPVIDGLALAYILSAMLNYIEKRIIYPIAAKLKIKTTTRSKKVMRNIGVFFTCVLFILILYSLVMLIVPQLLVSIQSIIKNVPQYFNNISLWSEKTLKDYPEIEDLFLYYWEDIQEWFSVQVIPAIQKTVSQLSTSLLGGVMSILLATWDFILGFIISIYLLAGKEKFCAQSKKVIYAFLKEENANIFVNNLRFAHKTFGGFLTGKIVDSVIIGFLCYFTMLIFKFPYALLISVVIGVTNVIPFFGPYLGAIPSAIIILMVSPRQCLYFIIFILILQQFDGNILGPKILGDSTGLSSFWVIFSITLFGGLFGIIGMFIGVPLFAVIYAAFRTFVNQRLHMRKLPADTLFYMSGNDINSDGIDQSGSKIRISNRYPDFGLEKTGAQTNQQDEVKKSEKHTKK